MVWLTFRARIYGKCCFSRRWVIRIFGIQTLLVSGDEPTLFERWEEVGIISQVAPDEPCEKEDADEDVISM